MSRTIVYAAVVGAVSFAGVANADDAAFAQANDSQQVFIDMRAPAGARDASAAKLRRKAARRGRVRVIVGLAAKASEEELSEDEASRQTRRLHAAQDSVANRAGVAADNVTRFDHIPFVSLWVNAGQLDKLMVDPEVVSIQEDVPGEPGLKESTRRIKATNVWSQGFRGNGFTVAILDTGVDKTHPMFSGGRVVSEACYSTTDNSQGVLSVCPGGVRQSTKPGSGLHCRLNIDGCTHGTHVAGIAAGNTPNLKGVANRAKVIAIQVFSRIANCGSGPSPCARTFDTDQIRGLERVYALRTKFKIAAANMSLGGGEFNAPCDSQQPAKASIIRKLRNAKIATVVASMNDGFDFKTRQPACISSAIMVGSTLDTADTISSFSNHLPMVRHMAPGSDIKSSYPNGKYASISGTSMATPHVAGAYAVLRNVDAKATVDDISAALECTGVPVTRAGITERRIDLVAAKQYLLKPPRARKTFSFNDNTAPGWTAPFGNWIVSDGFLQTTTNNGAGYKIAVVSHCNESMNIDAVLGRIWGSGQSGISGILFKAQFAAGNLSGYFAGYNANGAFVLLRFDNYNVGADNGNFAQLCSNSVSIGANGALNKIKLVSRGGKHKVLLNGTAVCNVTDYTYGTGLAGALAFFQGAGNAFGVDSFVITPQEVVPRASIPGDEKPEAEDEPAIASDNPEVSLAR